LLVKSMPRLAIVGLVGSLAAGCASDTMRFAENPFSNPFGSKSEPQSTAAINRTQSTAINRAPTTAVQSQSLAPPAGAVSSAPLAPPSASSARAAVAMPRATGPVPKGWSAQGGSSVTLNQGETLSIIANRYGVPEQALRAVNGISSGQPAPGTRIVIPVYNAAGTEPAAAPVASAPAHVAPAKTAAAAPAPVGQGRMKLVAGAQPKGAAETHAAAPLQPAQAVATKPVKTAEKPAEKPADKKLAAIEPAKTVKAAPVAPVKEVKPVEAKAEPAAAATPVKSAAPAATPAPAAEPGETASIAAASRTAATGGNGFRWPAKGRVIAGFGNKGGAANDGINIALPEGTPVKAAEGGEVAYAGNELKGYGNLVLIRHPDGWVSAYAHNGELKVKRGDKITRGQTVALSGQSGNVSSPQLHFELRKGATPVDPMPHLGQ
jgi:murein DD-endopeptidase MepM/ murein hydrolase activator NlpD